MTQATGRHSKEEIYLHSTIDDTLSKSLEFDVGVFRAPAGDSEGKIPYRRRRPGPADDFRHPRCPSTQSRAALHVQIWSDLSCQSKPVV